MGTPEVYFFIDPLYSRKPCSVAATMAQVETTCVCVCVCVCISMFINFLLYRMRVLLRSLAWELPHAMGVAKKCIVHFLALTPQQKTLACNSYIKTLFHQNCTICCFISSVVT